MFHRLARACIPACDQDDVLQDLRLLWADRRFDARRGSVEVIVVVILARVIADCHRSRGRRQRGYPIDSRFAIESLADHRHDVEAVDLAFEVASVLATLPEPRRDTAHQLKCATKSETARSLGISRSTVRTRNHELRRASEWYKIRNLGSFSRHFVGGPRSK